MKTMRFLTNEDKLEDEIVRLREIILGIRAVCRAFPQKIVDDCFLAIKDYETWIKDNLFPETTLFFFDKGSIRSSTVKFDLDGIWILGAHVAGNKEVKDIIRDISDMYEKMKSRIKI